MTIKLDGNQVVEIDGIKFTVRPEMYEDNIRAIVMIKNAGFNKIDRRALGLSAMSMIMMRVVDWGDEIIGPDDKPVECNMKNKMYLFAKKPSLLRKIAEKVAKVEDREEKNLKSSQDGSESP